MKRRTDLAALVSEHVALRRTGRRFVGLCPFHEEKTPSFGVDPERGFFYCFGCQAGGDAFTFLMKVTGASFPDVLRTLAGRAGVEIPDAPARQGLNHLAEINAHAERLFARALRESSSASACRAYLEKRGIASETIDRFSLGYASAEGGWVESLLREGATRAELERLGLTARGRSERPYPQFRNRLMFPIHDLSGRVIGFGGRILEDASGPKYLNSPETPLYHKGQHLYGLASAREALRSGAPLILVEGYMDAIALAQSGIGHVAAILGTALTVDQLRVARRFAEVVVICFDGDVAGRRAALRVFPLCLEEVDLWPRAAFLPAGDDPDSFVRARGPAALLEIVAAAPSLADVYVDDLVGDAPDGATRARAAQRIAGALASVKNPIVRDHLLRASAGRLGVTAAALMAAARAVPPPPVRAGAPAAAASQGAARPTGRAQPAHFSAEAELIELLLCDPDAAARAEEEHVLAELRDPSLRALGEEILALRSNAEHFDPGDLLHRLPAGMAERVVRRLAQPPTPDEAQRATEEWFGRRASNSARAGRQVLIAQLRAAEHRGDTAGVAAALDALRRELAERAEE